RLSSVAILFFAFMDSAVAHHRFRACRAVASAKADVSRAYFSSKFASARRRKAEPDWHLRPRRARYPEFRALIRPATSLHEVRLGLTGFEHRENISGRIFEPRDRRPFAAHNPVLIRLNIGRVVNLKA